MNVSEAMRFKREILTNCGVDVKMLDTTEAGLVLFVERSSLDVGSYKLLTDFAAQNGLSLQLSIGNFIISKDALSKSKEQ